VAAGRKTVRRQLDLLDTFASIERDAAGCETLATGAAGRSRRRPR